MKKVIFLVGAVVVCAMFFSSCSSTKVSSFTMAPYRNVTGIGVVNVPTLADLEVSQEKVFETLPIKVEAVDGMISGATIENSINKAISELLLKKNADVLVQPIIKTEVKGRTINVEVSGYPATYKNFRSMTTKDAELFNNVNIQHIPQGVKQSVITTEK